MYVYRCKDSLESVFSAIYQVYEEHRQHEDVYVALDEEMYLFAEEVTVREDAQKSEKVMRTLLRQFGWDDYIKLGLALSTPESDKAQAVYQTVKQGLEKKCYRGHLFDNLKNEGVFRAFELSRGADREWCHLRGFVRFEELENGMLYAQIRPKNNLVALLMPHFEDRFPNEDFLIHDLGRNIIGVHPKQKEWFLSMNPEFSAEVLEKSAQEDKYQMLFKEFCRHIGIKERANYELQRGLLPIHYRAYMTEFR